MQLIDSTAQDMGVEDVFDPRENILAGSRYLRDLIDRFGDMKLGLAAYNAGPGNVNKYGGIPPFKETQNYVRKVTALHTEAEGGVNDHISKVE
jgi:soluble lytic murein transglycosylase-like protein